MRGLELRGYQQNMVDKVRASVVKHKRTILCAVTGSGKSRMAKFILGSAAEKNPAGHYGFFVHRRGLVDNASNSFSESPALPHGVLMSGRDTAGGHPVQVGSIDTLVAWYAEKGKWESDYTFDVFIFDEAHSHHAKLEKVATAHDAKRAELGLKPCLYIGLTATPDFTGSNWYKDMVIGPYPAWMQEHGYAANFSYFGGKEGKLDLLKKRGGEFTKASVDAAMDGLAGDLVRDWKKYAGGAPTIGFFPRLSHAMDAKRILCENGIRAEYVDGKTSDEDRQSIFRQLDNLEIDYICNVGVIERGTDLGVGCVQLCTAVGSLSRMLQMIGRGSRVNKHSPNCVVIDHGGNIARHGFWEDERHWTIGQQETKTSDGERPSIKCPGCGRIYRGGKCVQCDYEPTVQETKAQGLVFDGGELKPITKRDSKPSTMNSDSIMKSALFAAGKSGRTCAQAVYIARSIAKRKGVDFKVPARIEHNGVSYQIPRYGSSDSNRRVRAVFEWAS